MRIYPHIKKFLFVVAIVCVIPLTTDANDLNIITELQQTYTQDTRLDISGSPYIARDDVTVNQGVTLTVDPGVVIWFESGTGLYVMGGLQINGTPSNRITIEAAPGNNNWDVISIIEASESCSFSYLNITGATHGKNSDRDRSAISARNSPGISLDHVSISNVATCIYFIGMTGECTFTDCYFQSYERGSTFNLVRTQTVIENCDFVGNNARRSDAIDFDKVTGTLSNNKVHDMTGEDSDGIDAGSQSEITIINNLIYNCSDSGIEAEEDSEITMKNNVVLNCRVGVTIKELATGYIENNTFYNNDVGFEAYSENHVWNNGGNVYVKNSIISGSSNVYSSADNSHYTFSYNLCDTRSLPGTGNIFANPMFENVNNLDFHLNANSPAIDAGDPASDLDPDNTRADIGAFPYNQVFMNDLIFTELYYYPVINGYENRNYEFIELYNNGSLEIHLGEYSFTSGMFYTFRDGVYISPGEYIIITKSIDYYEDLDIQVFEWLSGSLSNTGELIRLENPDGKVVTEIDYLAESPWPRIGSANNYSIELNDYESDYKNPESWRLSYNVGGTPGKLNQRELITNLYINEFVAGYGDNYPDENGNYSDWIELYNANDEPVNIGGLFMTDNLSTPSLYEITSSYPNRTTIPAGGYIVLRADEDPEQGALHLDFMLNSGGEDIGISQYYNNKLVFIDSVKFPAQSTDVSMARYPDGSNNFEYFDAPTPGSSNLTREELEISGLYINEIVSNYGESYPDEHGLYSDWIEIFNSNSTAVDIGGLYLTDDLDNLTKHQIPMGYPDSTTIGPGDYIVLRADGNPNLGLLHTGFMFMSSGEEIGLVQKIWNDIEILDSFTFGPLEQDMSYGRYPDGSDFLKSFEVPTPGAGNQATEQTVISGLYINEIVSRYGTLYPDKHGFYSDWIEIYNGSNNPIDIGGLYFSDNEEQPLMHKIPQTDSDSTTIQPGQFLVLRADAKPELGLWHLDFELLSSGEDVIITQKIWSALHTIDKVTFNGLETDVSYGRYPDGYDNFIEFNAPTPGNKNLSAPQQEITNLFINEFMAKYDNSYPDEHGLYSDWIEIYNANSEPVDLGGLYLSDNKTIPTKYQIPLGKSDSTTISARGFYVFRADALPRLGVNHLGFDLMSSGEDLLITQILGSNTLIIDSLSYDVQSEGISYGRVNNGVNSWMEYPSPTPGWSNTGASDINNITSEEMGINIFPNPFNDILKIEFKINKGSNIKALVTDLNGRLVKDLTNGEKYYIPGTHIIKCDAKGNYGSKMTNGIYLVHLIGDDFKIIKKALLIN